MSVLDSLKNLRQDIENTLESLGRDKSDAELIVVTKTISNEKILEAYEAGERDFGENRVQEWRDKSIELPRDIRWHLIGQLQTNKAKYVVGNVFLIHSLDRVELANEIAKQAKNKNIAKVACLFQINASGEETKSGAAIDEAEEILSQIAKIPEIDIKGLMAIGPLTEDEIAIRDCFKNVRKIFENFKQKFPIWDWRTISMGMSQDYRIALEEGSNMLRIGSLIFPREKM